MSTRQPPAGHATRIGEGTARVAQSALLREIPATVAAGRLATRYVSAAAEATARRANLGLIPTLVLAIW